MTKRKRPGPAYVVANPRAIPQDAPCILEGCERPGIHILRTETRHWHAGDAIAESDMSAKAFAHYRAGGFIEPAMEASGG